MGYFSLFWLVKSTKARKYFTIRTFLVMILWVIESNEKIIANRGTSKGENIIYIFLIIKKEDRTILETYYIFLTVLIFSDLRRSSAYLEKKQTVILNHLVCTLACHFSRWKLASQLNLPRENLYKYSRRLRSERL